MVVEIITFANRTNAGLINFQKSFERFQGWHVTILGRGIEWKGWITRMEAYMTYAQQQANPDTLLVFLDAFDVLCMRDADEFETQFAKVHRRFVFGCEPNCDLMSTCKKPRIWQQVNRITNAFVNGGCVIARAQDIAYLWKWCIDHKYTHDDQIALGYFMDEHPWGVALDTHYTFVFNDMFGKSNLSIEHDAICVDHNPLRAYFIHFPGLMVWQSIPLRLDLGKPPKNYRMVAHHLLGDEVITDVPMNYSVYTISVISLIVLFCIVVIICMILLILYIRCAMKKK